MATLIIKYDRKDFFGVPQYCEDKKDNCTYSDIKKAFRFLKNERFAAIEIDNITLVWNSLQDFAHKSLTCREYDAVNPNSYEEYLWDFEGCKNHYYQMYREETKA